MDSTLKGAELSATSKNYLYLHVYNLKWAVIETKVENITEQPNLQKLKFLLHTEGDCLLAALKLHAYLGLFSPLLLSLSNGTQAGGKAD